MPLVRYEVRCEHSLANPELYRSAARDDPESLLEGVAMAGLVGIVRQLGDLAEFAAEIFCGLHDELMTLGSRGHDLNMRVQQLEDELPAVEKALLSEPNQLRFAYTNGADWHASIRSDQNHCTSGDLPRFVRNYYEECRGPPQLFLLDKFDVSGVGACLKRYTDPSFFKLEWASTELLRAQREQRDKKARRDKKKGRKRRTGQPIAAINQIPARVRYGSASLEDLEGLPHDIASAFETEVPTPSRLGPNRGSDTQTPRGLPRGPKDMLAEESSLPPLKPIQVSAVSNTSEGVKYSKISARDTGSGNDSGNVTKPSEPEGATSSLAGRISRIIDLEDRDAAPATGYTRALDTKGLKRADGLGGAVDNGQVLPVDSKATNGISREDSGVAAVPRSVRTPVGTPRGTASGEFSTDVREGDKSSSVNIPVGAGSPTPLKSASRISVYMDALDTGRLSGKFLWKNNMDGNESSPLGGRFSRQISMARSGSEFDEFVDAPSRIGSEGDGAGSDFDSPGSGHRVTHFNGDILNHAALKNHVEAQKAYIPSGMKLMEQQQPHPIFDKLADISERKNVQQVDNVNPGPLSKNPSPISTVLNEDPPASSVSSGPSDTPAGEVPALVQQSEAQKADNRSGKLLEEFPGNGSGDSNIQVVPAVDISKTTEESNMLSSKATSRTPSSLGSLSSASSPTHAGNGILRPSVSMFSRHSYSSELISVSSDSEPNSPTSPNSPSSPNSPAFHALFSPRGSPPRESIYTIKSPPTTYLGSYSPGAHISNQSRHSLEEVPALSESPTSFSRSAKRDLALVGDFLPPGVIPVKSEPVNLPSRPKLQLYPLPTPPMSPERDNSSKSREISDSITGSFGGRASPGQNGESGHTRLTHEDKVHPSLQLSPTSKHDAMTRLEVPANLDEPAPPPVISANVGVTPSSPLCGTRYSAFSESTGSSLLLPSRVVDSLGSSAPSSPHGSPKKSFQRIFLSSPSVLASPSPLRNTSDDAPRCHSLGDEDSAPSSPSGSVIIKDSPPESPRSSYTGSECESRDFDAIQGRPVRSGSAGLSAAAREASVLKREAYVDEVASIASPRSNTSETPARTSPEQVKSLLLSLASHSSSKHSEVAIKTSAKFSLDSGVSNGSADHSVSHERILPSIRSPSIRPEVDPLPSTLKPISTAMSTTKSYKSMTSNSPPDSPGRMDQSSNSEWRGKAVPPGTPPRAAFKLPHHAPFRSPLRSPLHTPRSYFSETGTLKWLGRLDPGLSPKPDFSLPPNLVNHSETSSPACSPPPQLDLDSPTKSTVMTEVPEDLDSPPTTADHIHKGGEKEDDRLPDLPNPPASTSFVKADDFSSFRHDSEEDYNDENIRQNEPQRVELSDTSNSGPSHSSSSSFDDVPSSEIGGLEEFRVSTRVVEIEQLSVPVGRGVSKQPLPDTSWASVTASDKQNGVESYHVAEVDVEEADQSIEQSRVSSPGEAEDTQELDLLRNADAEVQSTDSKQASPPLFEESEGSYEFEHASDARICVAAQRDQDEVSESFHERFDEGDVCVAAHVSEKASPSPLYNEERTLNFEAVTNADLVYAAPANEKASLSPLERAERSLGLELVNEADICVAAHVSEEASPSPLENGERSLDFEPVNEVHFDGAAPVNERASASPLQKTEYSMDFKPVNEEDVDGAARFQEQLPLCPPQETDLSRNSAPEPIMDFSIAAQSSGEVLPSLSTPKPDNSDGSIALDRTEVTAKVHSMESPSPVPEFELRTTPTTKDALEAAIAQHDRNMLKVLTFQEPGTRPPPPPDERSFFIDQIRTTSFNLRRNEGLENVPSIPRPVANINVAAILEKANAIRQAFAGSDDDGEDDWSDS